MEYTFDWIIKNNHVHYDFTLAMCCALNRAEKLDERKLKRARGKNYFSLEKF